MANPDEGITAECQDAVLTITIDRQDRGNALSGDAAVVLADILDDSSLGTGEVRAVLIRAEGKHFCTGADISGRAQGDSGPPITSHMVRSLTRQHHRAVSSAFHCRVPVVAAVQGSAMGFGLHLALAADVTVAGAGASFMDPFTDRGFNVDSGGSWLLPRLVGLARAKRFLYLAERLDAPTALAWGLVAEVVPDAELDHTARAWAATLAQRPTQAVAATKRLLHDALSTDLDKAMHAEAMAVELTIRSPDFKEGMQAFFAKRPPDFTGR